ncbi:TOBE domain-containing protein [Burkholderia sp. WAC0059]|uniref:TOBE domain-containing protein n=1 Tax=Burkholderia sp. WAC0059 TaxID=2066022 RepID=UPI0035B55A91
MRAGRILQTGTPAELYARPASIEVARTIGTPGIGLVPARADSAAGGVRVAGAAVWPIVPAVPDGAALTLGLRSEHLHLVGADSPNALPARIANVEYLGADTLVHVLVDAEDGASPARLVVRVAGARGSGWQRGEPVGVTADCAQAVVFDEHGQSVGRAPGVAMRVVHG